MLNRAMRWLNYLFAATVTVTHIGGYVASSLGFLGSLGSWRRISREPVVRWLAVFAAYGLVRAALSSEPMVGLASMTGYITHWLFPFLLGYSLTEERAFRRAAGTFVIIFSTVVFVSMLSYFGFFPARFGDFIFSSEGLLKALRSHIALGALSLLFAFFALSQEMFRDDLSREQRFLYGAAVLFFSAALLLSGSRGYYIAAAVTFILFGIWRTASTRQWRLLVAGGLAIAVFAGILYAVSPGMRQRIHRTNARDENIRERVALYRVAVDQVKARPVFGFGPGQAIRQAGSFATTSEEQTGIRRHSHLHSFYLNLAADFGFVGLALFALIMYQLLSGFWTVGRKASGFVAAAAIGVFWGSSGILIGELFDTLLRGPWVAMEVFWLGGMILAQRMRRDEPGEEKDRVAS